MYLEENLALEEFCLYNRKKKKKDMVGVWKQNSHNGDIPKILYIKNLPPN